MNPALWVAKTGLDAQQIRLQVVSNNLANANTTGFKKDRAAFQDLIYQNIRQPLLRVPLIRYHNTFWVDVRNRGKSGCDTKDASSG